MSTIGHLMSAAQVERDVDQESEQQAQQSNLSALLALPNELLDKIYALSLPSGTKITLSANTNNRIRWKTLMPALTEVVGQDCLRSYYANNTFVLTHSMFRPGAIA